MFFVKGIRSTPCTVFVSCNSIRINYQSAAQHCFGLDCTQTSHEVTCECNQNQNYELTLLVSIQYNQSLYCIAQQNVRPTKHIKSRPSDSMQPPALAVLLRATSEAPNEGLLSILLRLGATCENPSLYVIFLINLRTTSETPKIIVYSAALGSDRGPPGIYAIASRLAHQSCGGKRG